MQIAEYAHLRTFESDFDRAQGTLRSTASLWILAAFASFSYVLAVAALPSDITRAFLGSVLAWTASFGVFILWLSDQLVYQKLLHSVFVHGLYLEWRDQSLLQIRTKAFFDNLNVSGKLSLFYLAPVIAFLLVELYFMFGTDGFALPSGHNQTPPQACWSTATLVLLIGSHSAATIFMIYMSLRDRDLLKQHGEPYPTEFKEYIRNNTYRQNLARLFAVPSPDGG